MRHIVKRVSRNWRILSLVLIFIVIVLIATNKKGAPEFIINEESGVKNVLVRSVAELSLDTEPLKIIGTVESESQVDVRTQSQGEITRVYKKLGDNVRKGEIIAEIENLSQRAAVSQAQSNLDGIGGAQEVAVQNAYRNLLSSSLEAVSEGSNSSDTPPTISGTYTGEEGQYVFEVYNSGQASGKSFRLISPGMEAGFSNGVFFNNSVQFGTKGLFIVFSENITGGSIWTVDIPNKRSSSYLSNLAAYNSALEARENVSFQLSSARSTLDQARAALEKTIIRSPIDGQITRLDLDLGDFVSGFQSVATVANEEELEIKTYITENDKKNVYVGAPVVVSQKYTGFVTSVAPAVDPATKKIEVSVSITEENPDLLNGQSVSISIERGEVQESEIDQIFVPLSSLKVTAEGVSVLQVTEDGFVTKQNVKEGPLVGNKVLIIEGLTPDMEIIVDVRGINEGDIVSVTR